MDVAVDDREVGHGIAPPPGLVPLRLPQPATLDELGAAIYLVHIYRQASQNEFVTGMLASYENVNLLVR